METAYFGRIMRVAGTQAEVHFLFASDEDADDHVERVQDDFYQWNSESETDRETRNILCSSTSESEQEHEVQHIRVIASTVGGRKSRRIELILDSGADVSVAPSWMQSFGRKAPASAKWTLRDAQGGNITVQHEIMLQDSRGNQVKIEEVFLIANVIKPFLAVGNCSKEAGNFQEMLKEQLQCHLKIKKVAFQSTRTVHSLLLRTSEGFIQAQKGKSSTVVCIS